MKKTMMKKQTFMILLCAFLLTSIFFVAATVPNFVACRDGTNWCVTNGSNSSGGDRAVFSINRTNGNTETIGNLSSVELFISSPPTACSAGTYMTRFVGNASTCVAAVRTTGEAALTGDYVFDTRTLVINASTDAVGVGRVTPARALHVNNSMRIDSSSAAPGSPVLGDMYVDSDTSELCFYNGTVWTGLQAGGTCA